LRPPGEDIGCPLKNFSRLAKYIFLYLDNSSKCTYGLRRKAVLYARISSRQSRLVGIIASKSVPALQEGQSNPKTLSHV